MILFCYTKSVLKYTLYIFIRMYINYIYIHIYYLTVNLIYNLNSYQSITIKVDIFYVILDVIKLFLLGISIFF